RTGAAGTGPRRVPVGRLAGEGQVKRMWMGGGGEGQRAIAAIELDVEHGHERRFWQAQVEEVTVLPLQHFPGRTEPIRPADDLLPQQAFLHEKAEPTTCRRPPARTTGDRRSDHP